MTRAKLLALAALAALAATTVLASSLASAASHRSTASPAATTIKTLQTITSFAPAGAPGVGTIWTGRAYHVDPKTGKRIGHGDAVCVQLSPGPNGELDCQGDDHFAGGDIREAGVISNPALIRWAIVGGTGVYSHAGGSYEARAAGHSTTKSHATFTIYDLGT